MNLKILNLTVLLITILVFIPTIQIVLAESESTFYISVGIYPHGDYTIWKQSSTYYAKSRYGKILCYDTNVSYVVNTAIQALPSGNPSGGDYLASGGEIYFSKGTYDFDTSINIVRNGTILNGLRRGTFLKTSNDITLIQFADHVSDCTIENLWLESNSGTSNHPAISVGGAGHIIQKNIIENFKYGIQGNDTGSDDFGLRIEGNIIFNQTFAGIDIGNGYSAVKIYGNHISGTPAHSLELGIHLYNETDRSTIFGNHIDDCFCDAIFIDATDGYCWHISIHHNDIERCGRDCISLLEATDCSLVGNTIESEGWTNNRYGINLNTVSHCTLDANNIDRTGRYGLMLFQSDNNIISNNQLWKCGLNTSSPAIVCDTSDWNVFEGNLVDGQSVSTWGFEEYGSSDYNVITSSSFIECTTGGITIVGSHTEVHSCYNLTSWIT